MSIQQRQKILGQKAQDLVRRQSAPGAYDPAQPQPRPNDVQLTVPVPLTINIRVLLFSAPVDILFKVRDEVNELINMRNNGGKH